MPQSVSIVKKYLNACLARLNNQSSLARSVQHLVLGMNYSTVILDDGAIGVSYTNLKDGKRMCSNLLVTGGYLSDRPLTELFNYCLAPVGWKRSLGVAALNAFSQSILRTDQRLDFNDDFTNFATSPGDKIGFIGCIVPLIKHFKKRGLEVIYTDYSVPNSPVKGVISVNDFNQLKGVKNLFISGSFLTYLNADTILGLSKSVTGETILIGPSAGCIPEPFFEEGISIIAGSQFFDSDEMIKSIQQGGGYGYFRRFCKKYTIRSVAKN